MDNQEESERRKNSRMPFREDILVEGMSSCTSTEISEGGIFVTSLQDFVVGKVVEISIPVGEGKMTVKTLVKYSDPGIGAGLVFIDLNDVQRTKIKELVESIAKSY